MPPKAAEPSRRQSSSSVPAGAFEHTAEASRSEDEAAQSAEPDEIDSSIRPEKNPEPYPTFDDDRPDSVFEDAAGEMPMDAGADLLNFTRMDAEILGPSRVRRELMAFEQAVEKVHPAVREVLEQSLRAEFREVREFKA